jgi:hypothetical protein
MRYVTMYSELYRLSERAYKKALNNIAEGKDADLDNLGKCLGRVDDFTELSDIWANELLIRSEK